VTAYGYIRVSTEGQADSGLSLDAQRQAIERYASSRGLTCTVLFCDAAESAGTPLEDRPSGAELLERLVPGDHVIVTRLDRAWRNAADCLQITNRWKNRNITLHVIDLGLDISTPIGRFFLTIAAAFAEMEREIGRERTVAALAEKKRQGFALGNNAPFGQRYSPTRRLEHDPREQAILTIMSLRHAEGAHPERIARDLNEQGYTTRGGRPWFAKDVTRLLAKRAPLPDTGGAAPSD
jgi:DNA invertase Pin-like site-specific DNA recombinase